jgi:hypothetical protein
MSLHIVNSPKNSRLIVIDLEQSSDSKSEIQAALRHCPDEVALICGEIEQKNIFEKVGIVANLYPQGTDAKLLATNLSA